LNVTVPVTGAPCGAAIVAVKLTLAPAFDGFALLASVTGPACCTCWLSAADWLAASFASPPYAATIECDPRASVAVLNTAVPALTAAVPSTEAPSEKVTVPVAAPPLVETLAVNITLAPNVLGFKLDASVVVLVAICTSWLSPAEVLPTSFASPPYAANSVCCPTASVEVVKVATPLAFSTPLPSVTAPAPKPSVNVIVPVAIPPFPTTFAVNVNVVPAIDGSRLDTIVAVVVAVRIVSAIGAEALAT
jgi:hypothetical protein